MGGPGVAQDRWWVVPAAAAVVSFGQFRFDLGAGAGVGTASGYSSWSDYTAGPFSPLWHFTVPVVRAHATVAFALNPHLDVFARFDAASLLFARSSEGAMATTWLALWIGVEPRLL
jgi:hypothetical protein